MISKHLVFSVLLRCLEGFRYALASMCYVCVVSLVCCVRCVMVSVLCVMVSAVCVCLQWLVKLINFQQHLRITTEWFALQPKWPRFVVVVVAASVVLVVIVVGGCGCVWFCVAVCWSCVVVVYSCVVVLLWCICVVLQLLIKPWNKHPQPPTTPTTLLIRKKERKDKGREGRGDIEETATCPDGQEHLNKSDPSTNPDGHGHEKEIEAIHIQNPSYRSQVAARTARNVPRERPKRRKTAAFSTHLVVLHEKRIL